MLPCNYSVKSTWAALRKCWLGFEISLSNDDRVGMTEFAYRIRKLQRQLAVSPTNFDPEILSEEVVKRIDELYSIPGMEAVDDFEKSVPATESTIHEREIDYDNLLGNKLLIEGNHNHRSSIASPRREIFATYKSRIEKSSPQSNRARIRKQTVNYSDSCPTGPLKSPKSHRPSAITIKKQVIHDYDKSCYIRSEGKKDTSRDKTHDEFYEHNMAGKSDNSVSDNLTPRQREYEHPPTEEEEEGPIQDRAEGDTGSDIDNNRDSDEPLQWAHVSDFQTPETTDPDHVVHGDNSCEIGRAHV